MKKITDAVGPRTRKRAAKTVPGVMARIMNEIIYNQYVTSGPDDDHMVKFVVANNQRVTLEKKPYFKLFGVEVDEHKFGVTAKVDVDKFMREVRDYFELMSYKEVIE